MRDRTIGRADLAPGVVAPRPAYVRRSLEVDATPVRVATVGGVDYTLRCLPSGPQGATAILDMTAAAADAPVAPLTASYTDVRRDAGSATEVFNGGLGSSFTGLQLLADASGPGTGRATLTGLVQYLDQPPARVDLGLAGVGGPSRLCRLTMLVAPIG